MLRSPPLNKTQSLGDIDTKSKTHVTEDDSQLQVTVRDKRRRLSDSYDELTAFKMEMREMFQSFADCQNKKLDLLSTHMEEVKLQNSSIFDTNRDIENSLEDMSHRLIAMQSKIDSLEDQRKVLVSQITNIDDKCEFLEKTLKKTSIELRYIPRAPKEDKHTLFNYITHLSQSLNISLEPADVRDVYRIPNTREPTKSTVVAEFSSTLLKTRFLSSVREFNKTKSLKILNVGIENNTLPLFVSESLTAKARRLHFLARDFARVEKYKYCWISNGNIYLRKEEGSEYFLIKNEAQLNSLKKSV